MNNHAKKNKKSKIPILTTILFLIIAGGGAFAYTTYFEGEKPSIKILTDITYLGAKNTIELKAGDAKSGLKHLKIVMTQGENSKEILNKSFVKQTPPSPDSLTPQTFTIDISPKKLGFKEGEVTLTAEVTDHSLAGYFKGNNTVLSQKAIIDTSAPKINILHSERYIRPGGSGIVIYRLAGDPVNSGLNLNGTTHPGFLIGDGRNDVYITYFGLPYNAEDFTNAFIFASDQAGNKTSVPVGSIFKATKWKQDRINVGNGFLNAKIPEFQQHYPDMKGTKVEQYLYANNTIRHDNNAAINNLCQSPYPERLWEGPFSRMAGSSRAGFADHRTYYHAGEPIDKQVHLGMDIASTRRVGIKAANNGKVTFADYLGIYGNMILLDHGQGVFSLYSHLSQINVAEGDMVDRGFVIGQSGTSGMAGGDHLHFSMLVNGLFVTPKEWWDAHWITVTIDEPLIDSKF